MAARTRSVVTMSLNWSLSFPIIVLAWLALALTAFICGYSRGRPAGRWIVWCLALPPVALILGFFPPRTEAPAGKPSGPVKKYKDEDFFKNTPPLSYEVRLLKSEGRLDEAAEILNVMLDEVELKSQRLRRPVPIWYYRQLVSIHRRRNRSDLEKKVLKRFSRFGDRKGAASQRLLARLDDLQG